MKVVLLFGYLCVLLHCHAQSECENCTTVDEVVTTPEYEDYEEEENTTSLIEPTGNTTVTNTTVQTNITTVLPLDPITTPAPHFPSRNLEPVPCTCDLLVDSCDIDCCCDIDCSSEDRQVFSHCVSLPLFPPEPRSCQRQGGGLLCLSKDNVPQRYWLQHPKVVTALDEFRKFESRSRVFTWPAPLFLPLDELLPGFPYKSNSIIWTLKHNKTLQPLRLYRGVLGSNCDAEDNILYLKNWKNHCTIHLTHACKANFGSVNSSDFQLQMLSNPIEPLLNQSEPWVIVQTMLCSQNCTISDVPFPTVSDESCKDVVVRAKYEIQHNGTEGIVAVKLLLWLASVPLNKRFTQHLEVEFSWIGDNAPLKHRSGRPGYLQKSPILIGLLSEGKESVFPQGTNSWLTIPSSGNDGGCQFRNPVLFKENLISHCNVQLSASNFTRPGCANLSLALSSMLLVNISNIVIGAFGDSEWGSLTDWLPIIPKDVPSESTWIDGVRENRTQKSDLDIGLCGGISTNMNIHILWSAVGSYASPQSKILGVKISFAPTQTLKPPQYGSTLLVKIGVSVKFTDATPTPQSKYAPPPKYEIRLPREFFYPLFSSASTIISHIFLICVSVLSACVIY